MLTFVALQGLQKYCINALPSFIFCLSSLNFKALDTLSKLPGSPSVNAFIIVHDHSFGFKLIFKNLLIDVLSKLALNADFITLLSFKASITSFGNSSSFTKSITFTSSLSKA